MCRMLALRSARPQKIDRLLLDAPRSLKALSHEHPNGWGIASHDGREAEVVRGLLPAFEDPQFERTGRAIAGSCLMAHIRQATVGVATPENTHPFAWGRWLFAHNGTVHRFGSEVRPALMPMLEPRFAAAIRGSTDSEHLFALFLTRLAAFGGIERPPLEIVASALADTIARVLPLCSEPPTGLTFLATDGESLVGMRCGSRELCFWAEPGVRTIIASEPLDDRLEWTLLEDGEAVGVDARLQVRRWRRQGSGLVHP